GPGRRGWYSGLFRERAEPRDGPATSQGFAPFPRIHKLPSRNLPFRTVWMSKLFSRRRLFAGFAAFGAVAGVFGLRSASARYYDGPVSDHFDGTRFFDVHGPAPKTLADQWRWYRDGNRQKWPAWAPSPYSDRPPERVAGP